MPDANLWRKRFEQFGAFSVGPDTTKTDAELEAHKRVFAAVIQPWLGKLRGPVLDYGCGIGRWVMDLPRPYLGLDLLPEHLELCKVRYGNHQGVEFLSSEEIEHLPDRSFRSIFTCTVLQHIVEPDIRRETIRQFHRLLANEGILLSVEWATGQWEADWCTAVSKHDLRRWFHADAVGEVVESGRPHTVWVCRKRGPILSNLYAIVDYILLR